MSDPLERASLTVELYFKDGSITRLSYPNVEDFTYSYDEDNHFRWEGDVRPMMEKPETKP